MKNILISFLISISFSTHGQNNEPVHQLWTGAYIGILRSEHYDYHHQYVADDYLTSKTAVLEYRLKKRPSFFSSQLAFRSTTVSFHQREYTHEFNDGDYSDYEGYYWNYKAETYSASLSANININLVEDSRFSAFLKFGALLEKALFKKIKRADFIEFNSWGGHYYDPAVGQVYYHHYTEEAFRLQDKLDLPKSIFAAAMNCALRFQFRLNSNQWIGMDIKTTFYPYGLLGKMQEFTIRKGIDTGITWGFGL